ncbi:MAG: hypothetical protein EA362_13030 [Saprospirales bacterium]|nr:MAG: hypothetical protein EA362_13030 [Saprospirales bacterium]
MLLFIGSFFITSCDREEFTDSPDAEITFSLDTLRFDTVFTERGTITRFLKVFNPNDKAVRISEIQLENQQSFFRFNADGLPQEEARDIVIWAKDSIYVFVEATIDPDQSVSASPFVIEEKLNFTVNGNTSSVLLEAYGQNANYVPFKEATGNIALLSCNGGTVVWDDPKPYVIFGVLVIDDCTLIIPEGARIHVHGGFARDEDFIYNDGLIFVGANGRLISEGTAADPVSIQGDRLEPGFANQSGQWAGIRLSAGSGPHSFKYTEIKNSIVGIRADSATTLNLEQVSILNTAGPGLLGIHNSITAVNTLIANNGGNSAQLIYGGNHSFHYTTLSNFGNQIEALRIDNFLCYDPPNCDDVRANPMQVSFVNSIIAGSGRDQIQIIDVTQENSGFMNFEFDHTLLRVFQLLRQDRYENFLEDCNNCLNFELFEPVFKSVPDNDYRLDSLSLARAFARPIPNITTIDLQGHPRDSEQPDAGAIEWKPEE